MGDARVESGQLCAAQSEWNRLGLYGSGVVASTRFKSHAEWGLLMGLRTYWYSRVLASKVHLA